MSMTTDNPNTKPGVVSSVKSGLKSAVSAILSRASWMARAGFSHDNLRDYWTLFGYNRALTPQDLYIRYRRQDLAGVIVDMPADSVWTTPPSIVADEAFVAAWALLMQKIPMWDILNRADKMTGWGRFSIIVLGVADGQDLDQPIDSTMGLEGLLYAQPYSELGCSIDKFDEDPTSPRFGLPLTYQISINDTDKDMRGRVTTMPNINFRVHHTRAVHIAYGLLEDNVYGIARLESCENLLADLLKVVGGSAETYWMTANRGLQIDVDKDMTLSAQDAADLSDEIDEYAHQTRRVLRTRGVKVNALGSDVPSPKDSFSTIVAMLSAVSRIPQRILIGSEAGQLASEQDRANWAERVMERRAKFAEPHALTPLLKRLIALGILPVPTENVRIMWPEAFHLAPLERAQTSAQKARSAINLAKTFTEQPTLVTIDEARKIIGFSDEYELLKGSTDRPGSFPSIMVAKPAAKPTKKAPKRKTAVTKTEG